MNTNDKNTTTKHFTEWLKDNPDKDAFITLSGATTIKWNFEMLKKYKERWDWKAISKNESIPWTIDMVSYFRKELYFYQNSAFLKIDEIINHDQMFDILFNSEMFLEVEENWIYEKLNWDIKKVAKFSHAINWRICAQSRAFLSKEGILETFINNFTNINLNWPLNLNETFEFIENNKYFINWRTFSSLVNLPWSYELIKEFESFWNFNMIFQNEGIPWSKEAIFDDYNHKLNGFDLLKTKAEISIKQFEYIVNKASIALTNYLLNYNNQNDSELMSCIIENYYDSNLNIWSYLSSLNVVNWDSDLILKYHDLWDWQRLSSNASVKWHNQDISLFADKVDLCRMLLSNPEQVWDDARLSSLLNDFPWTSPDFYCFIRWSVKTVKKYEHLIDWTMLSWYGILSEGILSRFKGKLHWRNLGLNHKSITNTDVYQKFYSKWTIHILSNPHIKFNDEDFLRFKNNFSKMNCKIKHGEEYFHDDFNNRMRIYIPNLPNEKSLIQIIHSGFSMGEFNDKNWIVSLEDLELFKDLYDFKEFNFASFSLDFIDSYYLSQFEES